MNGGYLNCRYVQSIFLPANKDRTCPPSGYAEYRISAENSRTQHFFRVFFRQPKVRELSEMRERELVKFKGGRRPIEMLNEPYALYEIWQVPEEKMSDACDHDVDLFWKAVKGEPMS